MQKYSRKRSSLRPAEAAPSLRTETSSATLPTKNSSIFRAPPVAHSSYAMRTRYRTSPSPAMSDRLAVLQRSVVIDARDLRGGGGDGRHRRSSSSPGALLLRTSVDRPAMTPRVRYRRSGPHEKKCPRPRRYAAPEPATTNNRRRRTPRAVLGVVLQGQWSSNDSPLSEYR